MSIIVSGCGEYECNGVYYQKQNNPPIYVQTNRNHEILQQEHIVSQGYGGCYKQKVWILQKMNTCNGKPCALYISYQQNYDNNSSPFSNDVEWKAIAGSLPSPQFCLFFLFPLCLMKTLCTPKYKGLEMEI